jgi:hypothetical protein
VPGWSAIQITLSPSVQSPQALGTPIVWTATATDTVAGAIDYRFRVKQPGLPIRVVREFYRAPTLPWIAYEVEGLYNIEVTARNRRTGQWQSMAVPFVLTPRATGVSAVITPTSHRLVVLYSAPACAPGSNIRVRYRTGTGVAAATPWRACFAGVTRNFLVAGLRPDLPYTAWHEIETQGNILSSAPSQFTSGALPPGLPLGTIAWSKPPNAATCLRENVVLHSQVSFLAGQTSMPVMTDLAGRVIWYYEPMASSDQNGAGVFRLVPGGTQLTSLNDPDSPLKNLQLLREIDLAGNTVRETNVGRLSEQLRAQGHPRITSVHHEVIRLPNGNLMALASVERVVNDQQGPGPVDVIGDALVELDADLQPVWFWNSFDHLAVTRMASLNETCMNGQGGCPPVLAADGQANDWTHANALHYTPSDGNLLMSIRHQDWVIKIDYRNRQGTGAVVWRLGKDGDFAFISSDPYPWFSHQHDAEFDIPNVPLLSVYDNGNLRRQTDSSANSRGQVFWIDERNRRATPLINADLGNYAFALGSAELLCNGNYYFNNGVTGMPPRSESVEVLGNGSINSVMTNTNTAYRTFRLYNVYGVTP